MGLGVQQMSTILLLLLGCVTHAAADAVVVQTIKDRPESMPGYPKPENVAQSGYYEPLGMGPIAVAHALQLPCGNKFLMMEFGPTGKEGKLMLPHPPTNPDGRNVLHVYDRDTETWTNIPTTINSVCGGWARLSNGQVGLFAGHYGTLGNLQVEGFKSIMLFDPTSLRLTPRANLTAKRWYPTTVTLPNGDVYVPGGTKPQMANGVWPKADGADIYRHSADFVTRIPTNKQLHEAGLGNWYLAADAVVVQTIKDRPESMPGYPKPENVAQSGYYEPLGMGPIAVAHALQLPCGNKFLMMEFGPTGKEGKLMLPHPPTNPDGRNVLHVYDRDTETWTNIPTTINSVCGGWARLSNGQVGLFAGHYGTLGNLQVEGFKSIMLFDPTSLKLTPRANLTAKRWYPTTVTLPNGDVYVPGGTKPQMANGVWPKADGADIYRHSADFVTRVPTNKQLHEAGLGNWYLGALVLPTGQLAVVNKNLIQVINPYSGEALAVGPPLPEPVKDQVWEFPRMGPQVFLRAPVMRPGEDVRLEFIAFGGSNVNAELAKALQSGSHIGPNRSVSEARPCAEYSVRIGLLVKADGGYAFDKDWEVEKMPAPRCIFDGVLLPNGHVVLLGGQRVGLGDLTDSPSYNGGHDPHNEAWIYKPEAPASSRFVLTGAKTRIPRLYHATSILTKDGDIWVGGSSNAGFWKSPTPELFSRTPLPVNEYRNEVYHPPYLFQPNRPRITSPPPNFAAYGSSFEIGFGFDAPGWEVTGVALVNAGGVTHNYAIGARSQLLDFSVARRLNATHGVLRVQAPAAPELAPPAHYMLFLLRGEAYSSAAWLQLRKPPGQVPVDYPQQAQLMSEMSSDFEEAAQQPFKLFVNSGRQANAKFQAPIAKGTGQFGVRVNVANGPPKDGTILLQSASKQLRAGQRCFVQLWAKSSGKDAAITAIFFKDASGSASSKAFAAGGDGSAAVIEKQVMQLQTAHQCLNLMGPVAIPADGRYGLQLDLGAAKSGAAIDIDDLEVYCA